MELAELAGVQSVKADPGTKKVTVTFDAPADDQKIRTLLAEIQYPAAA
jgi:copper chaperone CopZ